jgi:hypothetical protein
MRLGQSVVTVCQFRPFSFRFRKLATSSLFVIASLWAAPLWSNPVAQNPAIDRSAYVTVIGGRLGNSSDVTFSADPADDKIGNLIPLKPGTDANFAGITMGQGIDTHWDWKASVQSRLTDEATIFVPRPNSKDSDQWASTGLRLSTGDFELGYDAGLSPNYDLRLFAGARVLRAKNEISYRYHDFDADKLGYDHGTYSHKNEVKAIGPRLGFNASIPLGDGGPRLFSAVSGSVVFGEFESQYSYSETDDRTAPSSGSGSYSQDKKVTNAEASVGLQFDLAAGAMFEIGYRAETWQGLLNSVDDAQSYSGTFTQGGATDVNFQGPYLALTWKFGS